MVSLYFYYTKNRSKINICINLSAYTLYNSEFFFELATENRLLDFLKENPTYKKDQSLLELFYEIKAKGDSNDV